MKNEDYDAILSNWILCTVPSGAVFLAGRIDADRKGRFADGRYISTSLLVSPVEEIVDRNIVQTLNSRYLLKDRYAVDDALFAKLDAWLASQPSPPTLVDVIATKDGELFAAYTLRAFRAATAEAVWRRDGGK